MILRMLHKMALTLNGYQKSKYFRNILDISSNGKLDANILLTHLSPRSYVLNMLFKLYTCSFYGGHMWTLGSVTFPCARIHDL